MNMSSNTSLRRLVSLQDGSMSRQMMKFNGSTDGGRRGRQGITGRYILMQRLTRPDNMKCVCVLLKGAKVAD